MQPLTGKVYTHFSLKWSFLSFFLIFEIGSAICGAAQSSIMLILGRVVAGLGGSGLINGVLTIVGSTVEPKRRPMYTGLAMGCSQLGIIMGPLVGGALTLALAGCGTTQTPSAEGSDAPTSTSAGCTDDTTSTSTGAVSSASSRGEGSGRASSAPADSAGVRINATSTDSAIAETMVMEN